MRKLIALMVLAFSTCVGIRSQAQEIKTKVKESSFDIKPDAVQDVEFEEANTFVFGGMGWGRRTGKILSGFTLSTVSANKPLIMYQSTDYDQPFLDGVCFDLGLRHFFSSSLGVGVRGNYFYNYVEFKELDPYALRANNASAKTNVFQGTLELLYRKYLSDRKTTFVYGSLGLGWSLIDQTQSYRDRTPKNISTGFFLVRPAVGINIPVWDRVHGYAETGYGFSQGSISDGTLSLSQFQITAGVHIRLNSF